METSQDKSALLVIDWQKAFADAEFWGPRNNLAAESNATQAIEAARSAKLPIVHVHHLSNTSGSPLEPSSAGSKPFDFAEPNEGEARFTKNVNSAFVGTDLDESLKSDGIKRLYVMGVSTDHCVSTSVRHGANLGYEIVLIHDACFTFDRVDVDGEAIAAETVHKVQLASLQAEFATLMDTSTFILSLSDENAVS